MAWQDVAAGPVPGLGVALLGVELPNKSLAIIAWLWALAVGAGFEAAAAKSAWPKIVKNRYERNAILPMLAPLALILSCSWQAVASS